MATVSFGSINEYNALLSGPKHPGTLQYLEQQMTGFMNSTTEIGRGFYQEAQQLFNQFNGADAMRLARAAVRKVTGMFDRDVIQPFDNIGSVQNAQSAMQRWVMAEPTIRQMFHEQRCDGYSDMYVDMYPKKIGHDHYDYQRVMQGMIVDTPDEDWMFSTYMDDLVEGDKVLELDEQVAILSTWDFVKAHLRVNNDDPTSKNNSKL